MAIGQGPGRQPAHSRAQGLDRCASVGERRAAKDEVARYQAHLETLVAERTTELNCEPAETRKPTWPRAAFMATNGHGDSHSDGDAIAG